MLITHKDSQALCFDRSMYTVMRRREHGQAGPMGGQQISIFRG